MKRAFLALLILTALFSGCQAPAENRTTAETAASSARIDAEGKQAAWETVLEELGNSSLLTFCVDADTILHGTVSRIGESFEVKWQTGGDVSTRTAFTPVQIEALCYYKSPESKALTGLETYMLDGGWMGDRYYSPSLPLEEGDEVFAFISNPLSDDNPRRMVLPVADGNVRIHADMLPTFVEIDEDGIVSLPLEQFEDIVLDLLDQYVRN